MILNLLKDVQVDQLTYPYDMNTNQQLLNFANLMIRPAPSLPVEIFMTCDIIQCLITFIICTVVIVRKGRMRKVRLFSLRKSPYGTFIVPNAVWVLLSCIYVYLPTWAGFCAYIIYVQKTDRPLADWVWYIPLPWLPLALTAFYSGYGFMITCSPRSPISPLMTDTNRKGPGKKLAWYHLPLPKSALIMNTYLITVGVVMVAFNFTVQAYSGKARTLTGAGQHNLYGDVLVKQHSPEWLNEVPTAELLARVKLAWCDTIQVFRYCCLALTSYVCIIIISVAQLALYAVPNQIFLINHLCRIFPDPLPEHCTRNLFCKVVMLLTVGWPRNLKGSAYAAYKKSWMMCMVGHAQALSLLAAICAFSVPPIFLIVAPWDNAFAGRTSSHQVMFIIAYVITVAFLTAAWVTGLSVILTFEDIFRTVAGMDTANSDVNASHTASQSTSDHSTRALSIKREGGKLTLKRPGTSQSLTSRPFVRLQPSFAPSSVGSMADKDESVEELDLELGSARDGNRLVIIKQTTVTVSHDGEFESVAGGHDSIPMQTRPFDTVSMPYSYLARNAHRSTRSS